MRNMFNKVIMLCFFTLMTSVLFPSFSFAEDGICASVKIEIRQEMTLERQAFDAHMRINNGFEGITLDGVGIDVYFSDENGNSILASSDPNDTQALFFIRIDSKEGIDNIDGTGTVPSASSADIHWLIIPAPGASNGVEQGTLYYVGATLTYFINGEEYTTEVSPDYIFVKPMPELTLDYFLPEDVYGDDAFTSEIEPIIPFTLGVRVSNNGSGTAKSLKIDSAQPKIVENEQGLLIGFNIEGCAVNGEPANPSLLAYFGDIQPKTSGIARWIMTCSLSGKFIEFTADYSHSDELGGELTSLLKAANTHTLIHDVLVDSTGRDNITDFLAKYGDGYKVYESENIDNDVTDLSASSNINGSGDTYTLSTYASIGFIYIKLTDPKAGTKILKEVLRSDGKIIKPENAWLSKSRDKSRTWQYFFNLFDTGSTGSYTVKFEDASAEPAPPNLQFIPDRTKNEGEQLGFVVEASDPNGTIPTLKAEPLPAGAAFTDKGNGKGEFNWTPTTGQAGKYVITFTASDGAFTASKSCTVTITGSDSDNDGLPDYWETKYFGNLSKDGKSDSDGDGISDLNEYLNNTNPLIAGYNLTIEVNPAGSGTAVPSIGTDFYHENKIVNIQVTANSGYKFDHWIGEVANSASVDTSVIMNNSKTVIACFVAEDIPVIPGDIDNNGIFELKDAVLGLKIICGITTASDIHISADVNNDGKIGIEEVIYILQHISGIIFSESKWRKIREEIDSAGDGTVDYVKTYTYDTIGNLIRIDKDDKNDGSVNYVRTYTYNSDNRLIKSTEDYGNDGTVNNLHTYIYDTDGKMITSEEDYSSDGSVDVIHTFTYDSAGLLITEKEDHGSNGTYDYVYTHSYDTHRNFLKTVCDIGNDGVSNYVLTYTHIYDQNGNISKSETYRNDQLYEIISYTWEPKEK